MITTQFQLSALTGKLSRQSRNISQRSYDSDSFPIGIDSCTSATLTGSRNDFLGPLQPVEDMSVRGVGGNIPIVAKGTIRWWIDDDNGNKVSLTIRDAYYAPRLKLRLLCPQQWAKQGKRNYLGDTTRETIIQDNSTTLKWLTGTKTVIHNKINNLPIMQSAMGYDSFESFAANISIKTYEERWKPTPTELMEEVLIDETFKDTKKERMNPLQFDLNLTNDDSVKTTLSESDKQGQLLRWHYRLGHLPFSVIKNLAKQRILPYYLHKVEPPKCPGCLYSKAHRRPWRHKPKKKIRKIQKAQYPGHIVSVDQRESPVPGLLPQTKGQHTRQRFTCATVFVDQYSGLDYVHLQTSLSGQQTLEAKIAFERFATTHGVQIKHYHRDNGRFAEKLFKQAVEASNQTISFCGVNAHHQNGIAERRIRDLQDMACAMLLHAKHNWQDAIHPSLWPYALKHASNIRQSAAQEGAQSPLETFARVTIRPNLDHFHTFGCPVYILDENLQSNNKISKWDARARVGIYLGQSPEHASSVPYVLKTDTGYVSPQFCWRYM